MGKLVAHISGEFENDRIPAAFQYQVKSFSTDAPEKSGQGTGDEMIYDEKMLEKHNAECEAGMNQMGSEGWEIVSLLRCKTIIGNKLRYCSTATFKRPTEKVYTMKVNMPGQKGLPKNEGSKRLE